MKKKIKHTPTPWRFEEATKTIRAVPSNYWLATMDSFDGAVDNKANAELIIRAVNAHEELLLVAWAFKDYLEGGALPSESAYRKLNAIIAKAEGK